MSSGFAASPHFYSNFRSSSPLLSSSNNNNSSSLNNAAAFSQTYSASIVDQYKPKLKLKRARQRVDAGEPRNTYSSIPNYTSGRASLQGMSTLTSSVPSATTTSPVARFVGKDRSPSCSESTRKSEVTNSVDAIAAQGALAGSYHCGGMAHKTNEAMVQQKTNANNGLAAMSFNSAYENLCQNLSPYIGFENLLRFQAAAMQSLSPNAKKDNTSSTTVSQCLNGTTAGTTTSRNSPTKPQTCDKQQSSEKSIKIEDNSSVHAPEGGAAVKIESSQCAEHDNQLNSEEQEQFSPAAPVTEASASVDHSVNGDERQTHNNYGCGQSTSSSETSRSKRKKYQPQQIGALTHESDDEDEIDCNNAAMMDADSVEMENGDLDEEFEDLQNDDLREQRLHTLMQKEDDWNRAFLQQQSFLDQLRSRKQQQQPSFMLKKNGTTITSTPEQLSNSLLKCSPKSATESPKKYGNESDNQRPSSAASTEELANALKSELIASLSASVDKFFSQHMAQVYQPPLNISAAKPQNSISNAATTTVKVEKTASIPKDNAADRRNCTSASTVTPERNRTEKPSVQSTADHRSVPTPLVTSSAVHNATPILPPSGRNPFCLAPFASSPFYGAAFPYVSSSLPFPPINLTNGSHHAPSPFPANNAASIFPSFNAPSFVAGHHLASSPSFLGSKLAADEALSLVMPKKKRSKVTDTRISKLSLKSDDATMLHNTSSPNQFYPSTMLSASSVYLEDSRDLDSLSPLETDDVCSDLGTYESGIGQSSTLTPMHLRKAKLMFFYTRYPSSSLLKAYFPDIRFNKNNTAQLVKWFSNFREFYYIQMEKYARTALAEGVRNAEEITVTLESELYRVLNLHYNRNNHIQVPTSFRAVIEATLREFFRSIQLGRDAEPSWKKQIYKIIARLDDGIPEYFKTPNFLEQLE